MNRKPRSDMFKTRIKTKRVPNPCHQGIDMKTRLLIAYEARDNKLSPSELARKHKISIDQARYIIQTHQKIISRLEITGTNVKGRVI